LVYVTIGFNIPIVRQAVVFAYLSFMPGFVFLGALKAGRIGTLEYILFSVGLSIALLMFVGLFANELCTILGFSQPLSNIPIVITTSVLTIGLSIIGWRRDIESTLLSISFNDVGKIPIIQTALLMILPILGVVAAIYAKGAVPLLIVTIATLFVISVLSKKLIPVKLYPLLIFTVSLTLTLQFTMITPHVMGTDSPLEYFVYKLTAINCHWTPLNIGSSPQPAFNSMLSITILPAIYSALMNVDGELLFKLLYPVVFSFVPLILYKILAKRQWKTGALLSALFFISSPIVFYGVEPLSLNRQIVAELLLLLSVFLLLEKPFSNRNNRLIFIVLGGALAVSHYSLMIIYLIFLVLIYAYGRVKSRPDNVLDVKIILLLFSAAFSWYSLIPSGIITHISNTVSFLISHFSSDLFSPGARSSDIFTAHPVQNIASPINWTLFIIAHFLVLIGILAVMLNKQDIQLDLKYRVMITLSAILLFLAVAVPNLAPTLNFTRYYQITFLFLAPCFVFGGKILFMLSKKVLNWMTGHHNVRVKHVDAAMLLIGVFVSAYFLSQSGFINHIAGGSPLTFTVDWDRIRTSTDPNFKMGFYIDFTPEQDIASATWLSKFMTNSSITYSDFVSMAHPLKIYGLISEANLMILTNETKMESNSYIYLRYFNVIDGFVTPSPDWVFNTTELSPILNYSNCLYTNGGSMVYGSPSA
jgi:uncharacterized membrane protein